MDVRRGYKVSLIGLIPEQWNVLSLGDIGTITAGGTPSRTNRTYWGGFIPWVTTSEVDFRTITEAAQFITVEGLKNSAAKLLEPGTLLMALYGQGKTRGKVSILGIRAATNQACAAISLRDDVSREFVYHYLVGQYSQIRNLSNTGNQENLSGGLVRSIAVPIPTIEEQRAIATALSDVDALLRGLDQLIAKKRYLRQAAMQQLLSRETRLPGFSDEWEITGLGALGKIYGGLTGKTKSDFGVGSARYITFVNVMNNIIIDNAQFESVNVGDSESQNAVREGDLLFNGSSETPEEIAMCSFVQEGEPRLFLNSFCFGFRLNNQAHANGLFLAYYIRSREGRQLMKSLAQGSTRYNLSKSALLDASIQLPSAREQKAIVDVLSDMNAELAALEARRDKTRALKQAMMQELLTGKTRLVAPASNLVSVDFRASSKPASVAQSNSKPHNWQINEAVVVSVLVKHFGSEQFPLGRKRCTKLSYLMHRHAEHVAQGYLKKAAGPYNPAVKYKGPESIAQKNGYIRAHTNGKFSGFVSASKIGEAEDYFDKWYGPDVLVWLEQFRRKTNDELELLATVDMSAEDLRRTRAAVNVEAVKSVIRAHPEWEAKLERPIFSDANIARAIGLVRELFPIEG